LTLYVRIKNVNGQGMCVHSLGSQWHEHQISSMCVWRILCFKCLKFAWRFVVLGHPNGASCLSHTRLLQHNMTFVNFLMNSLKMKNKQLCHERFYIETIRNTLLIDFTTGSIWIN